MSEVENAKEFAQRQWAWGPLLDREILERHIRNRDAAVRRAALLEVRKVGCPHGCYPAPCPFHLKLDELLAKDPPP